MAKQAVITLVSLSVEAIQAGDFKRAKLAATEAIRQDPSYAEAYSTLGVVFAHLDQSDDALQAFKDAVRNAPTTPRYSYNLAAHQYVRKDFRGAYTAVSEALKDDPSFEKAQQLQLWIEAQDYDETVEFDLPKVTRIVSETPAPGPGHALAFMAGMEKPWKIAGWCFVGVAVIAAVLNIIFQPIMPPKEAVDGATRKELFQLATTPGAIVAVFFLTVSGVLSLMWMLVDIVDRRSRMVWLVPAIALCTCGMHALPHALYMLMRHD